MAHHLAHDHTILLLYEALIPFLIRTSSREGNLLTHTKVSDFFIDKLPTINGIKAQDRKREERSGSLESNQNRLSPTVEQGKTFCSVGGDIGQRDRVQAPALHSGPPSPPPGSPVWPRPDFPNVRIGICCLSRGPALVVERPWG